MFEIKTYIYYAKVRYTEWNTIEENLNEFFYEITKHNDILRIKDKLDLEDIYGAIIIKYNNQTLLDYENICAINWVWDFIITGIKNYPLSGKARFSLMTRPIELEFERLFSGHMLFKIITKGVTKKWALPEKEFLNALLKSAKEYFENMMNLFGNADDQYEYELKRIEELQKEAHN